jgi:glycosyltransferase involved in cell wall biosynthesis
MRITVALPSYVYQPTGGYHVHYEHANQLCRRGHRVTLVIPHRWEPPRALLDRLFAGRDARRWAEGLRVHQTPLLPYYPVDPEIEVLLPADLSPRSLPDADILWATAWQTCEAMRDAPDEKGRRVCLAYDYEFWKTADAAQSARMAAAFASGWRLIAGSSAVGDMLKAFGLQADLVVPCGLNFADFGRDRRPEDRPDASLAFPLRREPFKGARDAVAAVERLRERFGEALQIAAFGHDPGDLPAWVDLRRSPSTPELRGLYNDHAIFLLPSHFEGWGLPAVEAMACGAAVITADNGGGRDFALPGQTALVVPPGRPDLIAEAAARLIEDRAFRLRLAHAGQAHVQRYSWRAAADLVEPFLLSLSPPR